MPSTGRGEVAAPVGYAYKTCARIFKGQTSAEDESYSTKVGWETKKMKELTYIGIKEGGEEAVLFRERSYNSSGNFVDYVISTVFCISRQVTTLRKTHELSIITNSPELLYDLSATYLDVNQL
jgi:hypothetical protein